MSKLRMQPTVSLRSPPSMWLREKRGCQSGRPLKSRILAQTLSTGASITALTNTFVISSSGSKAHTLEAPRLLGQRDLGGQPLHAAGAVEAMTAPGALEDVLSIIWRCDGSAVAQDDYVPAHLQCCVGDFVDEADTRVERLGGGCADAAAHCDPHVRNDDVRTRL